MSVDLGAGAVLLRCSLAPSLGSLHLLLICNSLCAAYTGVRGLPTDLCMCTLELPCLHFCVPFRQLGVD